MVLSLFILELAPRMLDVEGAAGPCGLPQEHSGVARWFEREFEPQRFGNCLTLTSHRWSGVCFRQIVGGKQILIRVPHFNDVVLNIISLLDYFPVRT